MARPPLTLAREGREGEDDADVAMRLGVSSLSVPVNEPVFLYGLTDREPRTRLGRGEALGPLCLEPNCLTERGRTWQVTRY